MCLDVDIQTLLPCTDAAVTSDQKHEDTSPSSVAQNRHYIDSCQLPTHDNPPAVDISTTTDNRMTIDNGVTIDDSTTMDYSMTIDNHEDTSPSSMSQNQHYVDSCQLPTHDNRVTIDNGLAIDSDLTIDNHTKVDNLTTIDSAVTTDVPVPCSTLSTSPWSLSTFPGQLRLVPVVYVNKDGLPTCYEVVQPVPSPSYFHASSAHAEGSYDCICFPVLLALSVFNSKAARAI